jgi:hypothetical protein
VSGAKPECRERVGLNGVRSATSWGLAGDVGKDDGGVEGRCLSISVDIISIALERWWR